ncbi:MAG: hypothetical protein ABIJ09_23885 [Pseudomonadota bacterium]
MTLRCAVLLPVLFVSACLPPEVPLTGKACDAEHACGPDLVCCEGSCQSSCGRCPERACQLQRAVLCDGEARVCLDGCWEQCPSCEALCSDPTATRCELDDGETWFCQADEICLVRQGSGMRAECHVPPPWCAGQGGCACVNSTFALYPACDPWESCLDGSGGLVTCRAPTVDGGSHSDAGVIDRGRIDAGVQPDASSSLDAGVDLDAASSADQGLADVAPFDMAAGDAPWPAEAGVPDLYESDVGLVGDAGQADASVPGDAGSPDAAGPCGPVTPDCFAPVASGPSGEHCCDLHAAPAQCTGTRWQCPGGLDFAARCEGYGEACSTGRDPGCDSAVSCVWAWDDGAGGQACSSYGPAAPCIDGAWWCVAGSAAATSCSCVTPACP